MPCCQTLSTNNIAGTVYAQGHSLEQAGEQGRAVHLPGPARGPLEDE